jgi:hypothetical protein
MRVRSRPITHRLSVLAALAVCALAPATHAGEPPIAAGRVHALALKPAESSGPVTVRGIVTYSNPPLLQIYVQDDSGGVLVRHVPSVPTPAPGQRIEAVGKATQLGGRGTIERADLT